MVLPKHNLVDCGMLYRPQLKAGGAFVPLSWAIQGFRLSNTVCWPLKDHPCWQHTTVDRCILVYFCLSCAVHVEAEIRYFLKNQDNLDDLLTGVPTHLILLQVICNCLQYRLVRNEFKEFLRIFYNHIYLDQFTYSSQFRFIQRRLGPIHLYSFMYAAVCSCYLLIPILNEIYHRRDLLYKMVLPIDHEPWYVYSPMIICNMYVGVFVTAMLIGEDNLICEFVLHLNERYKLLREDLHANSQRFLREYSGGHKDSRNTCKKFRRQIKRTLQKNMELNAFAEAFQRQYSYRIFVIFGFSALLLCALGYKVYTNPVANIPFLFWVCAKVLEMLIIGELGSTLTNTTESLGSMYYESDWELFVELSHNPSENVHLMKLIHLAIATNQKPFQLRGLNFFNVSLDAVVKILQGAGSYFTCLIAMR